MPERVLEKMLCIIVTAKKMQFKFISQKGTIDAAFTLKTLHYAKEKSCECVLWTQRIFLTEHQRKCWNRQ